MRWTPTHRLRFAAGGRTRSVEVMAYDFGVDHPGPGRYGLFTRGDWERSREPEWEMDVEGRVWYRGEESPGVEPPTVESLWEDVS